MPITFDGVNDEGLMGATLYFPGYCSYQDAATDRTWAVSPDKVISVVLGEAKTLADVKTLFRNKLRLLMMPILH